MRRAVLAEADRVVREDIHDLLPHERREADRGPAVIREHEERAAVRNETAIERHAVHGRGHAVLADAVVEVAPREVALHDRLLALGLRVVRAGEVGRAADQRGLCRDERLEGPLRPYARRPLGSLCGCGFTEVRHGGIDGFRARGRRILEGFALARVKLLPTLLPSLAHRATTRACRAPRIQHVRRHLERRTLPAELLARAGNFFGTERRAVRRGRARLLRRAIADHGLAGDEPRLAVVGLRRRERLAHGVHVVAVDGERIPARRLEAPDLILARRERRRPVDRDAVVIEEHDQAAEAEVASERDRFLRDAFHEAAVAGNHVRAVVEQLAMPRIPDALGDRHADGIGETLAERARRRLDAFGMTVLGMSGRLRSELAKILDLLDGHAGRAGEMEERIEQHRAVPSREHEAVACRPAGRRRIEFHHLGKQHRRHIGHAHGHARVTGLRRLDGIHCQRPDGICHVAGREGALRLVSHTRGPCWSCAPKLDGEPGRWRTINGAAGRRPPSSAGLSRSCGRSGGQLPEAHQ